MIGFAAFAQYKKGNENEEANTFKDH